MNILIVTVLAFISTNIDDLFVLMLLFSQAKSMTESLKIAVGQFLGIGVLILVSIVGAMGVGLLPDICLRLLGLVPLGMGLYQWFCRKTKDGEVAHICMGIWNTVLLTIANGGDNLGVYIPLLTGFNIAQFVITTAVFTVMTVLWCLLGSRLASLPAVAALILKYQRVLVPAVLTVLGASVLLGA